MYTLLHNLQTGYGAKRASYPMVAGELPKEIMLPKRGADNLLRPRAEVKKLELHVYTPRQLPDRLWRQKGFLSNGCRGISQGDKAAKA
jgi:hypothetical protein